MIQKILLGILATVAFAGLGLVAIFMMQPSEVVEEHSVLVAAPLDETFAHVEDFRAWQQWSPLAGPDSEVTFSGTEHGEGAVLEWSGDEEIGAGRMTIVDSRPEESLEIEMELREPVHSSHTTTFVFEPVDDNTRVTWSTHTEMSAPMRVYTPEDSMKMIGLDHEKGLTQLAAIVENETSR